jgi:hypothetical protein
MSKFTSSDRESNGSLTISELKVTRRLYSKFVGGRVHSQECVIKANSTTS